MRALLMILSTTDREPWAQEILAAANSTAPVILVATPVEAAAYIAENKLSPSHVVLDIGTRGRDVLPEIDALAQQCEAGTKVVAVGDTNDITLYREILDGDPSNKRALRAVARLLRHGGDAADDRLLRRLAGPAP